MTYHYAIIENIGNEPTAIAVIASGKDMAQRFKRAMSEYFQSEEINFGLFSKFRPTAFELQISVPCDDDYDTVVDLLIQPTPYY